MELYFQLVELNLSLGEAVPVACGAVPVAGRPVLLSGQRYL